jgi:hypothetical protein
MYSTMLWDRLSVFHPLGYGLVRINSENILPHPIRKSTAFSKIFGVEEESQFLVSLTRLDILDGLADGIDAVLGLPTAAIVFKLITIVVPVLGNTLVILGNTLVILIDVLHRGNTLSYPPRKVNPFS